MEKGSQLYRVHFRNLQGIFARDLDQDEIRFIKESKAEMDNVAGSEHDMVIWHRIEARIHPKVVSHIML